MLWLTIKLDVIWFQHGEYVLEWDVNVLSVRSDSQTGCGSLSQRAKVIAFLKVGREKGQVMPHNSSNEIHYTLVVFIASQLKPQDATPFCLGKNYAFSALQTHHDSFLGPPLQFSLVGQHRGGEGAAIVPSPSHKHHTNLGHLAVGLESERLGDWSGPVFSIGCGGDLGGLVVVGSQQRLHLSIELNFGAVNLKFE